MDLHGEVTESVPLFRPDYASDKAREAGEELASLYKRRDTNPSDELEAQIAKVRGRLRRGPRLQAGEFLADGRYRLLRRLGKDQASVPWLAIDRTVGRHIQLRVMHDDWVTDDDRVAEFTRRALELGAEDHRGVARILDAGLSDEGFVYLASEFFGDVTLAQAIADRSIDQTDALQVLLEVARALAAVHGRGLVHGAVRPENVVLGDDGAAWLTNFTLGNPSAESSLFDAPESMQRGSKATAKSDVYSLGMTLLQVLHGDELPFWVLRDPGRLIDGVEAPDAVRDLLHRAVEWDLDKRWGDTNQMVGPILADAALVRALADRAASTGRTEQAASHLERLLALDPDDPVGIRARLGDLYTRMERYDDARRHLVGALDAASAPSDPRAETEAAPLVDLLLTLAANTGDWRKVVDDLNALAGRREGGMAARLLGTVATVLEDELDDATGALGAWRGVSAHHQDVATGRRALEARLRLAERMGAWRDYVEVAEQLLPYLAVADRGALQYAIGRALLLHLDDEAAGLRWLERAEESGHPLVDLADRLEDAWAARGQWGRVIEMMAQRAEEEKRKSEVSRILLRAGLIATSVHEEDLAVRVYRQLLDRIPDHTVALRHLARIHHRRRDNAEAEALFQVLLSSFKGKNPKEPEASERAADYTAWARILLRDGRGDEAEELLVEALRLNPNLIQSLRIAGPLYLDRGEPEKAGEMFDRLLQLYRAVDMSRAKTRANLGMGDVAWMQGRVTEAMGWANRALDIEPDEAQGWWGLSRAAMSARGGHPGAERAPWLMAVPRKYTPHEALARLLVGILDPERMKAWLARTGMGRALLAGGETPMRLACATVDVLTRYQLVDPDLFGRLSKANASWEGPVRAVSALWFGGSLDLDIAESYSWSRGAMDHDFDPRAPRELVPPPPELGGVKNDELRSEKAWTDLLGGRKAGPPPEPEPESAEPEQAADPEPPEVVVDGASGPLLTLWADSTEVQGRLGKVMITLRRAGPTIYLEAGKGLQVGGVQRTTVRLVGGEALVAGGAAAVVRVGSVGADARVPVPEEELEPTASSAPMADLAPAEVEAGPAEPVAAPASEVAPEPVPEAAPEPAAASPSEPEPAAEPASEPGPAAQDTFEETLAEPDAPDAAAEAAADPVEEPRAVAAAEPVPDTGPEAAPASVPPPAEFSADAPPAIAPPQMISSMSVPPAPSRRLAAETTADIPGVDEADGGVSAFRFGFEDAGDASEAQTVVGPPPTNPVGDVPADEDEDQEVVREVPGRVVASIRPPTADPSEPTIQIPVPSITNPAATHAATILSRMTPAPPERRDESVAAAAEVPEPSATPVVASPVQTPSKKGGKKKSGDTIVPEVAEAANAKVEVMSGASRGTTVDVGEKLVIGASADAGLALAGDARLGATHCEVVRQGDRYVLRDLGSEAGTVINGQRVSERDLEGGEVIMVGRTVLRFTR